MKIRAYSKDNRIPMALSNYISSGNGIEEDVRAFRRTVERAPFNAKSIAAALNSRRDAIVRFAPAGQTETTVIIEATDYLGSKDIIKITK